MMYHRRHVGAVDVLEGLAPGHRGRLDRDVDLVRHLVPPHRERRLRMVDEMDEEEVT
jgi:hypothetical protein